MEACVFDKDLVSQFHLLDRSVSDEPCTPPVFMAFDALRVHGLDVRGLPLHSRRYMLEPTLHVPLTYSEPMEGRLRDPVYRGLARVDAGHA